MRVINILFIVLFNSVVNSFANDIDINVIPPKEEVLRVKDDDIIIGCEDAPQVIIEYSSLSCPHCAKYYKDTYLKVKSDIINTCKAKYIYRDFPTTRSALKASTVVRCLTTQEDGKINSESFFRMMQLLFNSQSSWAYTEQYEEHLTKLLSITGIPQEKVVQCLNNEELSQQIIAKSFIAMKALNIKYSPSIFINNTEIGNPNWTTISNALSLANDNEIKKENDVKNNTIMENK